MISSVLTQEELKETLTFIKFAEDVDQLIQRDSKKAENLYRVIHCGYFTGLPYVLGTIGKLKTFVLEKGEQEFIAFAQKAFMALIQNPEENNISLELKRIPKSFFPEINEMLLKIKEALDEFSSSPADNLLLDRYLYFKEKAVKGALKEIGLQLVKWIVKANSTEEIQQQFRDICDKYNVNPRTKQPFENFYSLVQAKLSIDKAILNFSNEPLETSEITSVTFRKLREHNSLSWSLLLYLNTKNPAFKPIPLTKPFLFRRSLFDAELPLHEKELENKNIAVHKKTPQ